MPKQQKRKTGIKTVTPEYKPLSDTLGHTKDVKPEQTLHLSNINKNRWFHDIALSKIRDQIFEGEISEQLIDQKDFKPLDVSESTVHKQIGRNKSG